METINYNNNIFNKNKKLKLNEEHEDLGVNFLLSLSKKVMSSPPSSISTPILGALSGGKGSCVSFPSPLQISVPHSSPCNTNNGNGNGNLLIPSPFSLSSLNNSTTSTPLLNSLSLKNGFSLPSPLSSSHPHSHSHSHQPPTPTIPSFNNCDFNHTPSPYSGPMNLNSSSPCIYQNNNCNNNYLNVHISPPSPILLNSAISSPNLSPTKNDFLKSLSSLSSSSPHIIITKPTSATTSPTITPTNSPVVNCQLNNCKLCKSGTPEFLKKNVTWGYVLRVVFSCLKINDPEKDFFNLKKDVYGFMTSHWELLMLSGSKNGDNWRKQIQDMLSHSKDIFESGMSQLQQNGYWRLKNYQVDYWTFKKEKVSRNGSKRKFKEFKNNNVDNETINKIVVILKKVEKEKQVDENLIKDFIIKEFGGI